MWREACSLGWPCVCESPGAGPGPGPCRGRSMMHGTKAPLPFWQAEGLLLTSLPSYWSWKRKSFRSEVWVSSTAVKWTFNHFTYFFQRRHKVRTEQDLVRKGSGFDWRDSRPRLSQGDERSSHWPCWRDHRRPCPHSALSSQCRAGETGVNRRMSGVTRWPWETW